MTNPTTGARTVTTFLNPAGEQLAAFGLSAGAATRELVFAASMAMDTETLSRVPEATTIAAETRIVLANVARTLGEAGCTLDDVVKATCYLADDSYRAEFWGAWAEVFAPETKPTRLTFVAGVAGDCRVQVDVIAVR